MSVSSYKIAPNVTCHAWSPDRKRIAVCQNDENVVIYANADKGSFSQWTKEHVLKGHDLVVSAIDWSPVHNKIVTCSHDRNAFVWTLTGKVWKPSLSILRINRAALSVKWSPDGTKFAVGSGAKVVPVCHYEEQNDWWISKMIKKHKSTVIDVAWHPNSQLLATASSDFKCRVFSAYIPEVKTSASMNSMFGSMDKTQFGDLLAEFDASNGWVEAVSWAPSGSKLAFAGHDSSVSFVHFDSTPHKQPTCQTIKSNTLPNSDIMFMSDNVLVAVGFDYNPAVFQCNDKGMWSFIGYADKKSSSEKSPKKLSGFSAARNMWANKTTRGQEADSSSTDLWTKHQNTITCLKPFSETSGRSKFDSFSTTGLDGRLVVWSLKSVSKELSALKL